MKLDERGYPIPYFVPVRDGKHDFRYLDRKKQIACIEHKLCAVCGKRLLAKSFWFIAGPIGLKNKIASDPPMHEECARFSLEACPHLLHQKAERRSEPGTDPEIVNDPNVCPEKPNEVLLVKADWFGPFERYIKFRPVYSELYHYQNNRLVKAGA